MDLHDIIAEELCNTKSLAALIWLINAGRELEFSINGISGFISRDKSSKFVSLWSEKKEQSFDSVEELLEKAVIADGEFLLMWKKAKIEILF